MTGTIPVSIVLWQLYRMSKLPGATHIECADSSKPQQPYLLCFTEDCHEQDLRHEVHDQLPNPALSLSPGASTPTVSPIPRLDRSCLI